jgi:transcription elongation GreA/GreB family factor
MQTDKAAFKNKLRQFAEDFIQQQIALARKMIGNAREAANSEEKSSAGDKYETARSMGQLEQEMYGQQLAKYVNELTLLHAIDFENNYKQVTSGALVQCAGCAFLIAVGLGKQLIDGDTIYFLSPQAPLAKELQHKKAGDRFTFGGKQMEILAIC